jgi:hypothetical protein
VDDLERSVYNALLGALGSDASWWSHYSPLAGVRGPAPEQCGMHQNCCVASGPRALALVPQLAIMQRREGPVINLFCAGSARAATPSGAGVALSVETDYPAGDTIAIGVNPDRAEEFALRLRVPGWSAKTELCVNGESRPVEPGSYAIVSRTWAPGDTVTLKLDLRARAIAMPEGQPYTAVVRGPVVLAFDKRITRNLEGDGWAGLRVRADSGGLLEARPVAAAGGIRLAFEVPFRSAAGRETTLRMCDYASAGQTWSAASKLRVWLPPELDGKDLFAGVADEPERI